MSSGNSSRYSMDGSFVFNPAMNSGKKLMYVHRDSEMTTGIVSSASPATERAARTGFEMDAVEGRPNPDLTKPRRHPCRIVLLTLVIIIALAVAVIGALIGSGTVSTSTFLGSGDAAASLAAAAVSSSSSTGAAYSSSASPSSSLSISMPSPSQSISSSGSISPSASASSSSSQRSSSFSSSRFSSSFSSSFSSLASSSSSAASSSASLSSTAAAVSSSQSRSSSAVSSSAAQSSSSSAASSPSSSGRSSSSVSSSAAAGSSSSARSSSAISSSPSSSASPSSTLSSTAAAASSSRSSSSTAAISSVSSSAAPRSSSSSTAAGASASSSGGGGGTGGAGGGFDYIFTDAYDWQTFLNATSTGTGFAQHPKFSLWSTGAVIGVPPGNYPRMIVPTNKRPTNTVEFRGTVNVTVWNETTWEWTRTYAAGARINGFDWNGSDKIFLRQLRIFTDFWSPIFTNTIFTSSTGIHAGLRIEECDVSGNYRGDPDHEFDVVGDMYPEFAAIYCGITNNVITNVWLPGTGPDFIAKQYYKARYQYLGLATDPLTPPVGLLRLNLTGVADASNFSATARVIEVNGKRWLDPSYGVNGVVVEDYGGVRSFTTGFHYSKHITWDGQTRMGSYLPDLWVAPRDPNFRLGSMIWKNNVLHDMSNVFKNGRLTNFFNNLFEGNVIDRFYQDAISLAILNNATMNYRFNMVKRSFAMAGHPGDPHADGIQTFGGVVPGNNYRLSLIGNVLAGGPPDYQPAGYQGLFISDPAAGRSQMYTGEMKYNLVLNNFMNAVSLSNPNRMFMFRNVITRIYDSNQYPNATSSGPSNIAPVYEEGITADDVLTSIIGGNMAQSYSVVPKIDYFAYPNIDVPNVLVSPQASQAAYFELPHAQPRVYRQFVENYMSKAGAGYDEYGIGRDGVVDFLRRTVDITKEATVVSFDSVFDQTPNTLITSAWSELFGGVDSGLFSCSSGVQAQFADDFSGSNPTAWSASGTYTQRFVRLQGTTDPNPGLVAVFRIMLRGKYNYTWKAFNSQSVYSTVVPVRANSTWSEFPRPAAVSNIIAFAVVVRARRVSAAGGSYLINGGTGSTGGITFGWPNTPGTNVRVGLPVAGKNALMQATPLSPITQWGTYIAFADLRDPSPLSGIRLWQNLRELKSTSTAWDSTGSLTISTQDLVGSGGLGLFATNGGGTANTAQQELQFLWVDWYTASEASLIPDFTDIQIQARFIKDFFAADGSIPGRVRAPKYFIHGDQGSAWNSSLPNLGTLSASADRQNGFYFIRP